MLAGSSGKARKPVPTLWQLFENGKNAKTTLEAVRNVGIAADIAMSPSGTWLVLTVDRQGQGGRLHRSLDGDSWEPVESPIGEVDARPVAVESWADGFVLVTLAGEAATIWTSADGVAWEDATADVDPVTGLWDVDDALLAATTTPDGGVDLLMSPDGLGWCPMMLPADDPASPRQDYITGVATLEDGRVLAVGQRWIFKDGAGRVVPFAWVGTATTGSGCGTIDAPEAKDSGQIG